MNRLRLLAAAILGPVVVVIFAGSAAAWQGPEDDGGNLRGKIEQEITEVHRGQDGYQVQHCTWTDDDGEERDDGVLRWRMALISDGEEEADGSGTYYRLECWHDDMGCGAPAWPGDDGCIGNLATGEGFCGGAVCLFQYIDPEHLAWYAVDEFVQALPPPTPRFNPPGGTTYVNFPTWLWLDGVPGDGFIEADEISVPGFSVTTTAEVDSIGWTMGDGGEFTCPLTTSEANAEQACSYEYTRSSASQPGNRYSGEASIVWQATWTSSLGTSGTIDAPRSTDFNLQVAEIQTIVR